MKRILVVLVFLVVLAGCAGPSPETTTSNTSITYPDGLSESGIQDATALAEAHHAGLQNTSFTKERHLTIVAANGTVLVNETRNGWWEADRSVFMHQHQIETAPWSLGDAQNGTVSAYGDGTTVTRHQVYPIEDVETTNVVYTVQGEPTQPTEFWATEHATDNQLLLDRYQAVQPGNVSNESASFALESNSVSSSGLQFGSAETPVQNISNVSFSARISSAGILDVYELQITGEWQGTQVTVRETVSYSDVGSTTVEAPSWYSDEET